MRVVPVEVGGSDFDHFLELPLFIYPSRCTWLPPSKQRTSAELSRDNPFFAHGEAQGYICIDAGEVVGRIVASVDERRLDRPDVGHFGYFESVNSEEVAQGLLRAAENWLRGSRKSFVEGPIDLNIWTRYRLQLTGFESAPCLGEPRSPPYYPRLLHACGYRTRLTWRSYEFSIGELQRICTYFSDRRDSRYQMSASPPELMCERWNPQTRDFRDLHTAIMSSWAGNYGFSYIDVAEFARTFATLAEVLQPPLCFWLRDDRAIRAFGLGHLDCPGSQLSASVSDPRCGPRVVLRAYGIAPSLRRTHLIYEILRDLTWYAHAVVGLPAVLSLAVEQSDLWRRFKNPVREHAVFGKALAS